MGTTEHEEPRFFFILNKGAKSGGEITHAVLNGSIVSKPAGWDAFHGLALAREKLSSEEIQQHTAPDKDDKFKAYIRVADENILANEVLVLAWQKKHKPDGTLLKISKPVERLFAYLDDHPHINISQFCRIGRINYYTAKNILSDLLAMNTLQYLVIDKHILYQRVPA